MTNVIFIKKNVHEFFKRRISLSSATYKQNSKPESCHIDVPKYSHKRNVLKGDKNMC